MKTNIRRSTAFILLVGVMLSTVAKSMGDDSQVPNWDAKGIGPLPWQGITCLNIGDGGSRIVVGTIAPPDDPNVHVLDNDGKLLASYRVGQRWIEQVASARGDKALALCTMTTGASGDEPQAYLCGPQVAPVNGSSGGTSLFHYGDHSNHVGKRLAAYPGGAVTFNHEQLLWLNDSPTSPIAKSTFRNLKATALAVHRSGIAVLGGYVDGDGGTKEATNLRLFAPGASAPLWSRPVVIEVGVSNPPEPGDYGLPIHPNGKREPLAQRDEPTFAPLSIAITHEPEFNESSSRIAAADYRGWQRWIRSSGSGKEEHYGTRFMPAKPAITVYNSTGEVIQRFDPDKFARPGWVDIAFLPGGQKLIAYPHCWTSRGLAGQPRLPADDHASTLWLLDVSSGGIVAQDFPDAIAGVAVGDRGMIVVSCWNGRIYHLQESTFSDGALGEGFDAHGPALVAADEAGGRVVAATNRGEVFIVPATGDAPVHVDLNQAVPRTEKPWVKNATAVPIAKGLWQMPGGRVESDLGGQRLIEGPDGLILIESHSGLSFESEWAGIEAAGLDPRRVKYVVATHEHGDHAPGAYLWRVATGAQFISSREMAYVLQHHLPIGTGYGFHPPVPTDIKIEDDVELDLAGVKIGALRLSGHTFGSMGWLFEREAKRYVAIGDLIMPDGVLGYAGSINFSPYQVLASLRKLDDLKVDLILPGHGPIVGPDKYVGAGIAVGRNVGWGKMPADTPNPRFRVTQANVIVTGFLSEAVSGDFGDVDGDGVPDAVFVAPRDGGSVVKVFLNHGDRDSRFDTMKPEFEIPVSDIAAPSKIRMRTINNDNRADIFIAGASTCAMLISRDTIGEYDIQYVPGQELHQMRLLDVMGDGGLHPVLLGRFSGSHVINMSNDKRPRTDALKPQIRAPYVDIRELDLNGDGRTDWIVNNGRIWLRGTDGRIADSPSHQLPLPVADAWCYVGIGDFNGDHKPDVAMVSYGALQQQITTVFHNTGDGKLPFTDTPSARLEVKAQYSHVRDAAPVADWNGDGFDDLIIGLGQDKQVRIFFGDKNGLSSDRTELIPLEYRLHYEHGLTIADFNADDRPDLACFGYTETGVGAGGPPAGYIWLQPTKAK